MKRVVLPLLSIVATITIFGCKGDNDILATYKGGSITRGEFYSWLESKHLLRESLLKSKKKQTSKLNKMMIEKIAVEKAKVEGLENNEDIKTRRDLTAEGKLIKMLYEKEVTAKVNFKEPAVKLKQIFINVKQRRPDKNPNKQTQEQPDMEQKLKKSMEKGKEVLRKLAEGKSFEELAKKYSDHHSKMKGGDIGYSIRNMLPVEVANAAFSLDEGDYSKEPIKTSRGIYIIKVEDKEELTESNINDVIENKTQVKMIINRMQGQSSKDYLDSLMNAKDVEASFDKVSKKNKKDIIFKIGEKQYTNEDLNKRIDLRMKNVRNQKKPPEINDARRQGLAKNYYRYELLKRDAYKKGLDKDPEYIKGMQYTVNDILSREYMKKMFETEVAVTNKEIKEEYNKNKEKKYYKLVKKRNKKVKQVEPFKKVKEKIEGILKRKKGSSSREKWKKDILKEYTFKIDESGLEGE